MPNWCITEYRAVGEPEEITKLYDLMSELQYRENSLVDNDFGTTWFGNLVTALNKDWHVVRCRGSWNNLCHINDNTLSFFAESAWNELCEVRAIIEEKFPSIHMYYIAEEPGMMIYETNDSEGRFWKALHVVETEDVRNEYETLECAVKDVEAIIGRPLQENEAPEDAMLEWSDENGVYGTYFEYQIVNN